MNKFKIAAVLTLVLATTGCMEDKYVSVRHPEGDSAVVSTDIPDEALEEDMDQTETENTTDENTKEATETEVAEDGDIVTDADLEEPNAGGDGVSYTVDGVVNVRMAPSENSSILTTAEPSSDIIKLGDSDNWSRVTVNGQTGYIRSDLLRSR